MKAKVLNIALIISSLLGYLQWGEDNSSYLFEVEFDLLKSLFSDIKSLAHPFVGIPLLGQLLLLVTLFQKKPSSTLTYIAIGCLGLLLVLLLFVGIMASNLKIILSTVPFLISAFLAIRYLRNHRLLQKQ